MNFCTTCGAEVALQIPEGDDRKRYVCLSCQSIHYTSPRVIVGCLPIHEGKVLLCRRAIEPRRNYWTLPAGFMENGETSQQGAARETWEEAEAKATELELYRIYDIPHISQVYMFYRCGIEQGAFGAGPESLESALFEERDIPWDELAFPVVSRSLKEYFSDATQGRFPVRVAAIERRRKPS
ncbi:NUDIX hydrolase [Parahaliea sp. F7430]|uniref:NUDIX hydrolase n=1 Tax=Sediminihaliea albiluteola TaxID=2758564 RepID=A0A7W2TUU7_9GAMM|nr:NUDIX hydrolase [Sediminihaliea albiluteola]MBA6412352.1 NUDIX hydrolase [Sediminihaliea albiluteola]